MQNKVTSNYYHQANMNSLQNEGQPGSQRVAVIGAGVAGLGAAWHLSGQSTVNLTVYEMETLAGGHANTVTVDGTKVDTGFMVFNPRTYPNMISLFDTLGVKEEDTEMSFSVSLGGGKFEWNSDNPFVQKSNLLKPSFHRMLADMLRFNQEAPRLLLLDDEDPRKQVTLKEFLKDGNYTEAFTTYYLVPMAAAVWSAKSQDVLDFPARTLFQFFHNHNFLQVFDRPQWKTVEGRSREYVQKISNILGDRLKTDSPVTECVRTQEGDREIFVVKDSMGNGEKYDQVIFACHPDQALDILGDSALPIEKEILSKFEYQDNDVYLHSDESLMPVHKGAWAAWNYLSTTGSEPSPDAPVFVTYWLNKLQNLDVDRPLLVSLNPSTPPKNELVHQRFNYAHPQFTEGSVQAQQELKKLQGENNTWFCGAYTGYGFHEDGLRSGLEVATQLTKQPVPWANRDKGELCNPEPDQPLPVSGWYQRLCEHVRVVIGKFFANQINGFLNKSIKVGLLVLKLPDGKVMLAGDPSARRITVRVFDWNFFIRVGMEYDLGLARSYMAGEWEIEEQTDSYDRLTDLFILFCNNRDEPDSSFSVGNLFSSWLGYAVNFLRYRFNMDNSLSGSRSNISAHYDLSNELFETFLDKEYMVYSSGVFDAVASPMTKVLTFKDNLESAEMRKLDTLISKCRVERQHRLLDIGCGWGGLAIRAAETTGCRVHGITLSIEQMKYAQEKVKAKGLDKLITFEIVDYRVLAKREPAAFDRIISCEMIEAVGHNYLGSYFDSVDKLLKPDGVFVMQAITTPEGRYPEYLRSTDFINTIVFPGSCCPSLTALMEAMSKNSNLCLEGLDNICLHYAHTLRQWRKRFNGNISEIRAQGFDSVFIRCWNYYLCYCEAGFQTQTEGCLQLVFSRPGNINLLPYATTQVVDRLSNEIITNEEN